MEKTFNYLSLKNTRQYMMYSLVFFLSASLFACKTNDNRQLSLILTNGQATGIIIPNTLIKGDKPALRIVLYGSKTKTGILGEFVAQGHEQVFKPVMPLSPGLSYDILQDNRLIGTLSVPLNKGNAPQLVNIYPQQDTVPENLLKFYFHFSQPMRTGEVLRHIFLLDKNKDSMRNVFLNLQPELWDHTETILTLWLDPGRIKRDLVLNRELGNPLQKAQTYQLIVSGEWKDNRGLKLSKTYAKEFIVGDRDSDMPYINKWELNIPKTGSSDPLVINTHEPLDHYLLEESVAILDNNGKMLYSANEASNNDRVLKLKPLPEWKTGKYSLLVKATLEDLAGNNLNRVFDRDIRKDKQQNKDFFVRTFEVK